MEITISFLAGFFLCFIVMLLLSIIFVKDNPRKANKLKNDDWLKATQPEIYLATKELQRVKGLKSYSYDDLDRVSYEFE